MGWLFTHHEGKRALIRRLIAPDATERRTWHTLAHSLRGNRLWAVVEIMDEQETRPERYIACYLLAYDKSCRGWGYKDMDESLHPFYYDCPLGYLAMAPIACEPWREEVRAYHARLRRPFEVGQTVTLGALDGGFSFERTEVGEVYLYGAMPGEDWTYGSDEIACYLQGLPVYTCGYGGQSGRAAIVHLDPTRFLARLPDRDRLIDEPEAIGAVWAAIKAVALRRLHVQKTRLAHEAFIRGFRSLRHWGAIALLNDVPFLPPEVLWSYLLNNSGQGLGK